MPTGVRHACRIPCVHDGGVSPGRGGGSRIGIRMLIGQHLALKTQKKGYIGLIDLKVDNSPPPPRRVILHTPQPKPHPHVTDTADEMEASSPPLRRLSVPAAHRAHRRLYTSRVVVSPATDGDTAMNGWLCPPAAERDAAGGVRHRGRSQHLHATVRVGAGGGGVRGRELHVRVRAGASASHAVRARQELAASRAGALHSTSLHPHSTPPCTQTRTQENSAARQA